MIIVGCDFHPGWQQVAVFDSAIGEIREEKLENSNGEAERLYRSLPSPARVDFEACGRVVLVVTCRPCFAIGTRDSLLDGGLKRLQEALSAEKPGTLA
jgi:hypothetical protein